MIDEHEKEMKAMELFKAGKFEEAIKLQDEFLKEVLAPGQYYCPCPVECKFHMKCIHCVTVYRGHADHLPYCLHQMVNKRLEALSALTEHSIKNTSAE